MSEKLNYEKLFLTGLELEQKFDYYFLGVIIAILSFSIQSFEPDKVYSCKLILFVSWSLLFISLLAGFYRLERIKMMIHYDTNRMYKIQYENYSPNSDVVTQYFDKSKNVSDKALSSYKVEKWSFIIAILGFLTFKIINMQIG
ncbi:MAG: hypothetical protein GY932_05635 [Arcobacter sp.]|nr:hypothetical protein [Arcobacter sp.]